MKASSEDIYGHCMGCNRTSFKGICRMSFAERACASDTRRYCPPQGDDILIEVIFSREKINFTQPLESLSSRERDILQRLLKETSKEIASMLYLSVKRWIQNRSRLIRIRA
jgi:DNA-binding NarL/FixJ family response regulator